jgi:hypothetical protein
MIVGYAPVSTVEQNPDHQIDALLAAGVERCKVHVDLHVIEQGIDTATATAEGHAVPGSTVYGYLNRVTAGTPA